MTTGSSLELDNQVDPVLVNFSQRTITVKEGQFVFLAEKLSDQVYLLKTGAVKLISYRDSKPSRTASNEHLLKVVEAGEFFGYENLTGTEPLHYSAQAIKDCEILVVSKSEFDRLFKFTGPLVQNLLRQALKDLDFNSKQQKIQYMASVQQRIALALLSLAERFGKSTDQGTKIDLKLSRKELAQLAGTIDESLSRHLGQFRDLGFISIKGKEIVIRDFTGLQKLTEGDYSPSSNK